ncbi:MAG: hypothetical protein CVT49_14585 [candidate division Zixibacteria bacterium HGW-Zixibacteria-1]|nr:MAG: hypothetical protein CVT49_14585 [candidate division Zixibacteria bacterium HGW-Zixibacteria-1]
MSRKLNCWEYRNCGMEPGGIFSEIHGACPVPQMMKFDGANGGRGAGRACWMVMNKVSGKDPFICRHKRESCIHCDFYRRVHSEEETIVLTEPVEEAEGNYKFTIY